MKNKKFLFIMMLCLMTISCCSFFYGCDDGKKGGGENSGGENDFGVAYNLVGNKTTNGYTINSFSVTEPINGLTWSNDDATQIKTHSNSKIKFSVSIEKGWKVASEEQNNFKVFVSSDNIISEDDLEARMISATSDIGVGTNLYNYVNVFLKSNSTFSVPTNVPARTTPYLYFSSVGERLDLSEEEYNNLSDSSDFDSDGEITCKSQCQAFYRRTLQQALEKDYDVERNVWFEFDGMNDGNYYVLVQTNAEKSQTLQVEARTIKLTIPEATEEPYVSFASYDTLTDSTGVTYVNDAEKTYKTLVRPYGSNAIIKATINTQDDSAKYYNIGSATAESNVSVSWTNYPGNEASDIVMERVSADGKQKSTLMSLDFLSDNPLEVLELELQSPELITRSFIVEIKDSENDNVNISQNVSLVGEKDLNSNTYVEQGFELQFFDYAMGESGDWRELDFTNNEGITYYYLQSIAINKPFLFRIKINNLNNKLEQANYFISYEEMVDTSNLVVGEYLQKTELTESFDTSETGVTYVLFNSIPAQDVDADEFNILGVKLIIENYQE